MGKERAYIIHLEEKIPIDPEDTEIINLRKGYIIAEKGQKTDFCYILKEGCIIACDLLESGKEVSYHIYEAESMLMEENLLYDQKLKTSFQTIESSKLIKISKKKLLEEMRKSSLFSMTVSQSLALKCHTFLQQLIVEREYGTTYKICNLLLEVADFHGVSFQNKIKIRKKFSQQLMANLLGLNRITVVKAIKNLKERRIIDVKGGHYIINDRKKLSEYVKCKKEEQ